MTIPRDRRTTKQRPCPACSHPQRGPVGHCFFLAGHEAVWCANQPTLSGRAGTPRKGGWVHRLTDSPRAPYVPTRQQPAHDAPRPDFPALARRYARQLTAARADALARSLGLSTDALARYRVGWATPADLEATSTRYFPVLGLADHDQGVWTFPMRDGAGNVVGIGTRLLKPNRDGKNKFRVTGSDGSGLFLPVGLTAARDGLLLAPEGPTSSAALAQLGFIPAGRPNNRAGTEYLRTLCRDLRPRVLVIVGDNDERQNPATGLTEWPGLDGAEATAHALRGGCPDVRVMLPPAPHKDARAWLAAGATHADVWRAISSLTPHRLTLSPGRLTA